MKKTSELIIGLKNSLIEEQEMAIQNTEWTPMEKVYEVMRIEACIVEVERFATVIEGLFRGENVVEIVSRLKDNTTRLVVVKKKGA